MAAGHGKDTAVHVNGRNMSTYLQGANVELSAQVEDATVMSSAAEKLHGGLYSGGLSAKGLFDGATAAADQIFNAALISSSQSLIVAWIIGETAVGAIGYAMRARATQYKNTSPVSGLVACALSARADEGVERVKTLHPLAAETIATNGTTLDDTASTTAGAAAYLTVTAFTGTSITVKVQDSADGTTWADVTSMAFTAASAAGTSERVATSATATIRRYVRVTWTGTFTSATFSVAFARK